MFTVVRRGAAAVVVEKAAVVRVHIRGSRGTYQG